jgi:hypothetical protein
MAEIEMEESFETTTVRRKTVRQSLKIQEVSNFSKKKIFNTLARKHIWSLVENEIGVLFTIKHIFHWLIRSLVFHSCRYTIAHIYKEVC